MRCSRLQRFLRIGGPIGRCGPVGAGLLALSLAGCAGDPPPQILSPEAFKAGPSRPPSESEAKGPKPKLVARPESPGAPIDVSARVGPPVLDEAAPPVSDPVLIDSKIGDINGHPVWASQVLSTMSDRLRSEADKVAQGRISRAEWLAQTRKEVKDRLGLEIDNQLIRDEGLSTLTPEMKVQGMSAILGLWRQSQKSRNGGSEVLADRAARENAYQAYQNLDEQVRDFKDRLLINIVIEKIEDSIVISSADIRRFYESNPELFDPPPVAAFSMILVSNEDPEAVAIVRWALEEGAEFSHVAGSALNSYRADTRGRMPDIEYSGEYAQAEIFGAPHLAGAARTLRPGQWTGPFPDGRGSQVFLRLDAVITNTVSLYDAQTAIESYLRNSEFQLRLRKRIDQMKSRSSLTDEGEMVSRLMDFAETKYLAPALRQGAAN